MQKVVKDQLDLIREKMLSAAVEGSAKSAVEEISDDELLVLVFENLHVANDQEYYLLGCLKNRLYKLDFN